MTDWSLDMSWVESTTKEVDFVVQALDLRGGERILDLACGFGRHALELARRGYATLGVDFTPAYIARARSVAREEQLGCAEFLCADVRSVSFHEEFDVVLNMADGAIGYFDTDQENLKLFDRIGAALKADGQHVMGVCSAAHAIKHFPKRHWQAGSRALSLADFRWDAAARRMIYRGHHLKYGATLEPVSNEFSGDDNGIRLYTLDELAGILSRRGLRITAAYGNYDVSVPASEDALMQVVCSRKE
jgi:cyclopropane fatty-acyl-phospholipid synthase-like methyltransferase